MEGLGFPKPGPKRDLNLGLYRHTKGVGFPLDPVLGVPTARILIH